MCAPALGARGARLRLKYQQIKYKSLSFCAPDLACWGARGVRGGESWAHLAHVSAISPSTKRGQWGAGLRWVDLVPLSSEEEGAFSLRGSLPGHFSKV